MSADKTQNDAGSDSTYEPPRIETVLAADDLAREIQYAGVSVEDEVPA